MNRSELMCRMAHKNKEVDPEVIDVATREIFELMSDTLVSGNRIEIRNFGSFGVKIMPEKKGRNPKTGEKLIVAPRPKAFFKPGKPLEARVDTLSA
jgi:integration host factor subunit beta